VVEIGKSSVPAGELTHLLLALERVEDFYELIAFRANEGFFGHCFAASLTSLSRPGKAQITIDSPWVSD
jgi:hypothetical protein